MEPGLSSLSSLVAFVALVGLLTDAIEHQASAAVERRSFRWDVVATAHPILIRRPALERLLGIVAARISSLAWARAALALAAAIAFLAGAELAAGLLAASVAALTLALSARLVYGLDGSDQMQMVVWAGLAASSLVGWIGIYFVAAQFLVAYLASGLAKAFGPTWRSGSALSQVLSTNAYGSKGLSQLVAIRPVGLVACWGVIVFEALGPVAALGLNPTVLLAFAAAAVLFHVSIAVVMGLNSFVWAFSAALCCFVVCAYSYPL
jgi:hypothetical protein